MTCRREQAPSGRQQVASFPQSYLAEESVASRMWMAAAGSAVEALKIPENCSIGPCGLAFFGFGWRFKTVLTQPPPDDLADQHEA
jgi:hypothetical protein